MHTRLDRDRAAFKRPHPQINILKFFYKNTHIMHISSPSRSFWLKTKAGSKMYWTDTRTHKIQRANLDGSNIEDLISTGLRSPRCIALYFSPDR
ncbi:MAG: hypothetical protein F4X51_13845 [Gemmatimonadetes bacterium]|nr:hypothetical protein [Gemmatimonadota bacterium]